MTYRSVVAFVVTNAITHHSDAHEIVDDVRNYGHPQRVEIFHRQTERSACASGPNHVKDILVAGVMEKPENNRSDHQAALRLQNAAEKNFFAEP